jgi:hypothetical protein
MTIKLRLGLIPQTEMVKLSISLPAVIKADLDRYAEVYRQAWGVSVDSAALIPHMLATFMARDRVFVKSRRSAQGRHNSSAMQSG